AVKDGDRVRCLRLAARALGVVLSDSARRRAAAKRGGGEMRVTFEDSMFPDAGQLDDVIALDDALNRLEDLDERQAQVVECRFFAGLSVEETARALGVGTATVKRDWRAARAWLAHELR